MIEIEVRRRRETRRRIGGREERGVAEGEEMDCNDKIISISGKKDTKLQSRRVMEKVGTSRREVNVVDRVIENDKY